MTNSQPSNDSRDFEGEFYTILSHEDWTPPEAADVQKDFFDASKGTQVGIRADGTPMIMVAFTPQGVKLIQDAARYWQDHNCRHAVDVSLYVLHQMAADLAPLMEHLPEVQDWEPFAH